MSNYPFDNNLLTKLQTQYNESISSTGEGSQQALLVEPQNLLIIMQVLKTEEAYQFDMLRNLTAVDYIEKLEMVYHLYSLTHRHKITVKTYCLPADAVIPSVTSVWPSANFQEREVYDLLGIRFYGHPDLRRILMPDEYTEHPLRKSFGQKTAEKR